MMWFVLCSLIPVLFAADSPTIGILSQETFSISKLFPNDHYDAYIAASYVKLLESGGARVVPVWIGQNESYYKRIVNNTNGLLFPGGATYFNESKGYGEAASHLYKYAKETNDRGIHYPILGICLGMQVIPYAALGRVDIRIDCNAHHIALPLDFEPEYKNSKLFASAPQYIIDILKSKNVTYNEHRYCLTKEVLKKHGLTDWNIITTNKDIHGLEFISSMEHTTYPFFGLQYHPEKNSFEFKKNSGIPKSLEAVQVTQYFADFFVEQCRKNAQTFNEVELEDTLIYNYAPVYTGRNSSYEQLYVFKKEHFKDDEVFGFIRHHLFY